MKTAEKWMKDFTDHVITAKFIEAVQKDAWNSAINAGLRTVRDFGSEELSGEAWSEIVDEFEKLEKL